MSHSAAIFCASSGLVLLLALVEAAVLQQHHLAGLHVDAVDPVGLQRHLAAEQLGQALGHRRQRVLGLELALGGTAQVRGDHHRRAGVQRHADAGHRGADARVFGDVAGVVLRHVEVGADEHALAARRGPGRTDRRSGGRSWTEQSVRSGDNRDCRKRAARGGPATAWRALPAQPQVQRQVDRHAGQRWSPARCAASRTAAAPASAPNRRASCQVGDEVALRHHDLGQHHAGQRGDRRVLQAALGPARQRPGPARG